MIEWRAFVVAEEVFLVPVRREDVGTFRKAARTFSLCSWRK
jgi:hypothetical protein